MQKAIRRGDGDTAADAAVTLLALDRQAPWRRLLVTAFEDIGFGSPTALSTTVAACTDAKWRRQSGGDVHVATSLAHLLAAAPKDRSADYLVCAANDHPLLRDARPGDVCLLPQAEWLHDLSVAASSPCNLQLDQNGERQKVGRFSANGFVVCDGALSRLVMENIVLLARASLHKAVGASVDM